MVNEFGDDGAVYVPDGGQDDADLGPSADPIVAEVRAVREAIFAEAHYDLDEYVRRVRAAQAHSTHTVVTLPPKRSETAA